LSIQVLPLRWQAIGQCSREIIVTGSPTDQKVSALIQSATCLSKTDTNDRNQGVIIMSS